MGLMDTDQLVQSLSQVGTFGDLNAGMMQAFKKALDTTVATLVTISSAKSRCVCPLTRSWRNVSPGMQLL